jgi:type I restriction enzyme S subunit
MGDLKPGWKRVKFGEVVRLNKETCKDPAAAGIHRVIGLEHLEPGDLRVRSWADVADGTTFTNRVRPGQVLFGKRRAYQRKVAVADFDAICSGDIYVFESANPEKLLPELLPFLCQTDSFFGHAVGTSAGSLSPRTNWSSLAGYEFALPPLEDQRRMVDLLQASIRVAQAASESREAIGRASLALATRIFQPNGLLSKYQAQRIGDVADIRVGIVITPAKYYVPFGVPALRPCNVYPHRFDLTELVHLSDEGDCINARSRLQAGDVVVVRVSGSADRPGDAAVVTDRFAGFNCVGMLIARPQEGLLAEFLVEFLNSPPTKQVVLGQSVGTNQKQLNAGNLQHLRIITPPTALQREVVEQLAAMRAAASILRERALASDTMHASLLQMTGMQQ